MDWLDSIDSSDRVVVVGVGSTLRGDDGAGVEVVRRLANFESPRCRVIEGGTAPENYTSVIKSFEPDHILFIDAVEFGDEPGVVKSVNPDELEQTSFSSHAYPLSLLTDYVERETNATVSLIGIQPETTDEPDTISPDVQEGVDWLVELIVTGIYQSDSS